MTCVKMLADYEVRFDCLEKGLWLQAHFYDADPRFKEDLDDGVVPVGRRSMGWRFLLAEEAELKEVEQVLVDGDRMLVRMGEGLVDVMRLDGASALLLSDGGGPSLASKLQGVVEALKAADPTMDDESALPLPGPLGSPWRGPGNCSPCGKSRLKAKREVGWTVKVIKVLFGAIGGFCRWLIKAVFRFM